MHHDPQLEEPRLTVVIPAYQAEEFIADGVNSVLTQDPQPHEIIVVDDGSTDGTAAILASFGDAIRVVTKPNGGEASARNAGLRAATTPWVAFMDADDQFAPGRLAAVIKRLRTDDSLDLLTTNAHFVFPYGLDGFCYGPHWSFAHTDQRTEIIRRNFIFSHTVVRRERLLELGGFDETIKYATDWAMWLVLILNGGKAGLIDEPLSLYRVHTGSLSANTLAMARGYIRVMEKALELPLSAEERAVAEDALQRQRALLDRETLSDCLATNGQGARKLGLGVARNGLHERSVRLRALVAVASPGIASRIVRRRRERYAVGTMGRTYRRTDDEQAQPTA